MKKLIAFLLFLNFLNATELNIGVALPLSGQFASYGQSALSGIKLANSMQNTFIKDNKNIKVNLVILDTKGDKIEALNSAKRLISQNNVLGLIAEMLSSNTLQVMSVAEDTKTPLIAPAATGDRLLENKKYSSRVCFKDSFQGKTMAKYVYTTLKYKSAVVVVDQSTDYSLGLAKAFEDEFKSLGGQILKTLRINSGDKDFKAIITQIQTIKPEFVFLPLYYPEASIFTRQARLAGLNTQFGSADGVADKAFIDLAGKASQGYIFTDSFDEANPSTELAKEFINLYKEQYKKDVPAFAAMGSDAYFVMFNAIKECSANLNKECINDKIHSTSNFKGVSGLITIDKSGNATRSVVIKEIKNQKQTYKDTINP